ncbi:MAG TPA: 2-dehydro-3-deoxygalactonokinase [Caulobacterales bacterium]|nr:2-dehydro-3-deoxygalactonokinase [Caulobacterales bacterium]
MSSPVIGVDWGTTNMRAFRFDAAGNAIETRRSHAGTSTIKQGAFEDALHEAIGDWLTPDVRIVVSGMAGSREGWREAPYLACPADLAALANAMVRPDTALDALIAPGLSDARANGLVEVMRGEETQIFGALSERSADFVIAPGTHSKWARIESGRIASCRTYMTGELYAVMRTHSILARLIEGEAPDAETFAKGVKRSLRSNALLNLLFSVRTEGLFAHIAPEASAAYLSGLLIGAEIAEGFAEQSRASDTPILIIAAPELGALYRAALALAGFNYADIIDGERAAARGLWALAQARSEA